MQMSTATIRHVTMPEVMPQCLLLMAYLILGQSKTLVGMEIFVYLLTSLVNYIAFSRHCIRRKFRFHDMAT
jgi:type III secretory pathway component EscU